MTTSSSITVYTVPLDDLENSPPPLESFLCKTKYIQGFTRLTYEYIQSFLDGYPLDRYDPSSIDLEQLTGIQNSNQLIPYLRINSFYGNKYYATIFTHIISWFRFPLVHKWFVLSLMDGRSVPGFYPVSKSNVMEIIDYFLSLLGDIQRLNDHGINLNSYSFHLNRTVERLSLLLETTDFEEEIVFYYY